MKRSMFLGVIVALLSMGLMFWGCSETVQNPLASAVPIKISCVLSFSCYDISRSHSKLVAFRDAICSLSW
jgi:hypothetical protein